MCVYVCTASLPCDYHLNTRCRYCFVDSRHTTSSSRRQSLQKDQSRRSFTTRVGTSRAADVTKALFDREKRSLKVSHDPGIHSLFCLVITTPPRCSVYSGITARRILRARMEAHCLVKPCLVSRWTSTSFPIFSHSMTSRCNLLAHCPILCVRVCA